MDDQTITSGLHPLEIRIIRACPEQGETDAQTVCKTADMSPGQFRRGFQWLVSRGTVAVTQEKVQETAFLTELGKQFATLGEPGQCLINKAKDNAGITVPELLKGFELPESEVRSAFGQMRKQGILVIDKGLISLDPAADTSAYADKTRVLALFAEKDGRPLSTLAEQDAALVRSLVHKRIRAKGIFYLDKETNLHFTLTDKGRPLQASILKEGLTGEEISRLTPEMLREGAWRGKSFRQYSFDIAPPRKLLARKHPYREFLDFVKYKLTAMGFQEMRGPLVECEFWNMDALYMPQFHSAREIHDAYFVKQPGRAKRIDPTFLKQVAATHEQGGDTGSAGWNYQFDSDRTHRLVLRTQGTALSARQLGKKPAIPGKYFAMARCFRPDTVDATHACDFFQCEGIMLAEDINFRTLLGLLKLFAHEVAKAEEVKFVPAYFPFTEPSVEAHMRHPRLGWIELGGAGIFRPEVTQPLGVDAPVLAWGLGLDRMAMVALKIDDIRELFTTDLDALRTRRLELDLH